MPITDEKPNDTESPTDLLYGVLSVVSQFSSVLRERGQEYRNSRAGAVLGAQLEKMYDGVTEREKNILDVLVSSLGSLAATIRQLDEGLNDGEGRKPAPMNGKGPAAGGQQTSREAS